MESLVDGGSVPMRHNFTILNEYDQNLCNKMGEAGISRRTYESKPLHLNQKLYFETYWFPGGSDMEKTPIWVESDYSVKIRVALNNAYFNNNSIQGK